MSTERQSGPLQMSLLSTTTKINTDQRTINK